MLIKKEQAQEFTIPGGTTGRLYPPHPNKEQSAALVEMDGHYPPKGWAINNVSTETMLLLEGKLEVDIEDKTYALEPGDLVFVLPKNKYRTRGKCKVAVLITPSWDQNINKFID